MVASEPYVQRLTGQSVLMLRGPQPSQTQAKRVGRRPTVLHDAAPLSSRDEPKDLARLTMTVLQPLVWD